MGLRNKIYYIYPMHRELINMFLLVLIGAVEMKNDANLIEADEVQEGPDLGLSPQLLDCVIGDLDLHLFSMLCEAELHINTNCHLTLIRCLPQTSNA